MVKRSVILGVMLLAAGLLSLTTGCSDDDGTTGPGGAIVGDTSDPAFRTAATYLDDAGASESFFTSIDATMGLLESQFPNWSGSSSTLRQRLGTILQDTAVVSVGNYTYVDGWHIFEYSATILTGLDTVATISGTDSVRIQANGVPLNPPDSTADELNIRNHGQVNIWGDSATFAGQADHIIDLTLDDMVTPNVLTINGTGSESLDGSTLADGGVTCSLSVSMTQAVNNLRFPEDTLAGDFSDCPQSGSLNTTATLNLTCTSPTGLDSLNIDGTWTFTALVLDNGDIRLTWSNGTVAWTVVDTCNGGSVLGSPPWMRER